MLLSRNIPVSIFMLFFAILIISTLYYAPGWGLMDDATNILIARNFWQNHDLNKAFQELLRRDVNYGRFRPLYYLWIVLIYRFFAEFPLYIYILMLFIGVPLLLLWGVMVHEAFSGEKKYFFANVFVFPLSFFIFTPFWNNFMYISIQEKFIYIFTTVSLFSYFASYKKNSLFCFFLSWLLMFMGILSKETGIALVIVYIAYSIFDLIVFKENRRLAFVGGIINFATLCGYYFFMKYYIFFFFFYSARYENNMDVLSIMRNINSAPVAIKALLVFALVWLIVYLCVRKRIGNIKNQAVLFPLFFIAYALVLSPWGFSNYLLAPLAPVVLVMLYPLYAFVLRLTPNSLKWAPVFILVLFSSCAISFIVIPRISKMADKRKVVGFIKSQEGKQRANYFFPRPFEEQSVLIAAYTGSDINYLSSGELDSSKVIMNKNNYLLYNDECSPVKLSNVSVKSEVYRNGTWRVFQVMSKQGNSEFFKVDFPENFFEKLKGRAYKK